MEKIFNKISEIRKQVKDCLCENSSYLEEEFPVEFYFYRGFGKIKYKITIEIVAQDFIIDDLGRKWILAKEDDE